ncbi:hypothetical protein QCA50_000481 [Cerrena zonata]|uniref:WD40 repeat-like protein n=1 Tax=Cerrena zonata TaxID=2478898 RepID=A0AAW0GR01_9APHY
MKDQFRVSPEPDPEQIQTELAHEPIPNLPASDLDSDSSEFIGPCSWSFAQKLRTGLQRTSISSTWKKQLQCASLYRSLDRVNVLGSSATGHSGCVNALSWARDGELLLSGGDDTTVRIWRLDSLDTSQEYPFVCDAVIRTGHRSNIFANQMLPHSNRIATVARDKQVRVFDINDIVLSPTTAGAGRETEYSPRQTNVRILKCHTAAVKRISTQGTPDMFLTVSEDGTVREHDLRVGHHCGEGACPDALVRFDFSLSTLAMSPLVPWQFVVAGESGYGYLFDRRNIGRQVQEEWGVPLQSQTLATCIRRFGREKSGSGETRATAHVTGARMASDNGHEVLLSYSADAVYLYSTRDEPHDGSSFESGILKPNPKSTSPSRTTSLSPRPRSRSSTASRPRSRMSVNQLNDMMERDIERFFAEDAAEAQEDATSGSSSHEPESPVYERREEVDEEVSMLEEDGDGDEDEDDDEGDQTHEVYADVSVVLPRARFTGICNVETVKDVNFLGPRDEFVVSGSDDGNLFIWDKQTGKLCEILHGDQHVVNVIEGHPYLPLIAVSGIDTTVKLFTPARGPSQFSRMEDVESIIRENHNSSTRRVDLGALMMYARIARRVVGSGVDDDSECTTQ